MHIFMNFRQCLFHPVPMHTSRHSPPIPKQKPRADNIRTGLEYIVVGMEWWMTFIPPVPPKRRFL